MCIRDRSRFYHRCAALRCDRCSQSLSAGSGRCRALLTLAPSFPLNFTVDPQPPYLVPHSKEPIRLLYRDEHLLIVDKPTLLLSVPGRHPLNHDCQLNRLDREYPGVSAVHRLDLDTSGVMVVPRNKAALSELARQFQSRRIHKTYFARVAGCLLYTSPSPRDRTRSRMPSSA